MFPWGTEPGAGVGRQRRFAPPLAYLWICSRANRGVQHPVLQGRHHAGAHATFVVPTGGFSKGVRGERIRAVLSRRLISLV